MSGNRSFFKTHGNSGHVKGVRHRNGSSLGKKAVPAVCGKQEGKEGRVRYSGYVLSIMSVSEWKGHNRYMPHCREWLEDVRTGK